MDEVISVDILSRLEMLIYFPDLAKEICRNHYSDYAQNRQDDPDGYLGGPDGHC